MEGLVATRPVNIKFENSNFESFSFQKARFHAQQTVHATSMFLEFTRLNHRPRIHCPPCEKLTPYFCRKTPSLLLSLLSFCPSQSLGRRRDICISSPVAPPSSPVDAALVLPLDPFPELWRSPPLAFLPPSWTNQLYPLFSFPAPGLADFLPVWAGPKSGERTRRELTVNVEESGPILLQIFECVTLVECKWISCIFLSWIWSCHSHASHLYLPFHFFLFLDKHFLPVHQICFLTDRQKHLVHRVLQYSRERLQSEQLCL